MVVLYLIILFVSRSAKGFVSASSKRSRGSSGVSKAGGLQRAMSKDDLSATSQPFRKAISRLILSVGMSYYEFLRDMYYL